MLSSNLKTTELMKMPWVKNNAERKAFMRLFTIESKDYIGTDKAIGSDEHNDS